MTIYLRRRSRHFFMWGKKRTSRQGGYILNRTCRFLETLIKKNGVYAVNLLPSRKLGYTRVSVGRASAGRASAGNLYRYVCLGSKKTILCEEILLTAFGKIPKRFYFKVTKVRPNKKK